MWYKDLAKCNYFGEEYAKIFAAVGWLENGKPYTNGESPIIIVEKLHEFRKTSGMHQYFLGYHKCDFCKFSDVELGANTILIAYKKQIYACPALITHYIEKHQYLPPVEFIEAVLNYDHQSAIEYFKEIRENKLHKIK